MIKILHEYWLLHMNNCAHFRPYLAHFLLELKMFHTEVVGRIRTHFMFDYFFLKIVPLLSDNLEQYGTAGQAIDDGIIRRMRSACLITKATDTRPKYLILATFPRKQMVTRTRSSVTFTRALPVLC